MERLWEEHGSIEAVPKHFLRTGCKECKQGRRGCIVATYIYDDGHDLTVVINPELRLVITNYLSAANNKNHYKGRFRINYTVKNNRLTASF